LNVKIQNSINELVGDCADKIDELLEELRSLSDSLMNEENANNSESVITHDEDLFWSV